MKDLKEICRNVFQNLKSLPPPILTTNIRNFLLSLYDKYCINENVYYLCDDLLRFSRACKICNILGREAEQGINGFIENISTNLS